MSEKITKVAILGGGQWGRTLGLLLARKPVEITIWDKRDNLATELDGFYNSMQTSGNKISGKPVFESDFRKVFKKNPSMVFLTVPSDAIRDVAFNINEYGSLNCFFVIASKGFDESDGKYHLLTDAFQQELGRERKIGVLSGPNLSKEIQAKHPAVSIIASESRDLIDQVMNLLASPGFRIYGSHDIIGVQIGGAVKNVIALAGGMVDELGFEFNTKAALLTRGLAEITRLGIKLGGNRETFAGISSLGDLICTAFSPTSRNYRAGRMFGKGLKREKIEREIGEVIEGINTARIVMLISKSLDVDMPISHGVYRVVWDGVEPGRVIEELMTRELKFE